MGSGRCITPPPPVTPPRPTSTPALPHYPPSRRTVAGLLLQAAGTVGQLMLWGPVAVAVQLGSAAFVLLHMGVFDYMMHYGEGGGGY